MSQSPGTLYIVPLPIGNIDDITVRAIKTLQLVDVVAAEDTRVFADLAHRLNIKTKSVVSHYEHNEEESTKGLLQLLRGGKTIALTSDAGTPNISDPGYALLRACYENEIPVIPLPGASSVTTALSACQHGGTKFLFMGFAASKSSERQAQFQSLFGVEARAVFFESPHRICEHLADAETVFGSETPVFISREISKKYEEYLYLPIKKVKAHFEENEPLGEFVVVYPPLSSRALSQQELESKILELLDQGRTSKDILDITRATSAMPRQELYDLIQKVKSTRK